MTNDVVIDRTLSVVRDLYDLKEDILHDPDGLQPEFDAGVLSAALAILFLELPTDDARIQAEYDRQSESRLLRILKGFTHPSAKRVQAQG